MVYCKETVSFSLVNLVNSLKNGKNNLFFNKKDPCDGLPQRVLVSTRGLV